MAEKGDEKPDMGKRNGGARLKIWRKWDEGPGRRHMRFLRCWRHTPAQRGPSNFLCTASHPCSWHTRTAD